MDNFFRVFDIITVLLGVLPFCSHMCVSAFKYEVPECEPPDYPESGGYGPVRPFYVAGDQITYFCESEALLSGNEKRICDYNGDWSGDTPFCDYPLPFLYSNMSMTGSNNYTDPTLAHDTLRGTCASVGSSSNWTWFGDWSTSVYANTIRIFAKWDSPTKLYSVKVRTRESENYECSLMNFPNAPARLGWFDYNCTADSRGVAVYSSKVYLQVTCSNPLVFRLCEIYVFATPIYSVICKAPRIHIANGRLEITRTTATLVCNDGYIRSPETRTECVLPGVWKRRQLYCSDERE